MSREQMGWRARILYTMIGRRGIEAEYKRWEQRIKQMFEL